MGWSVMREICDLGPVMKGDGMVQDSKLQLNRICSYISVCVLSFVKELTLLIFEVKCCSLVTTWNTKGNKPTALHKKMTH